MPVWIATEQLGCNVCLAGSHQEGNGTTGSNSIFLGSYAGEIPCWTNYNASLEVMQDSATPLEIYMLVGVFAAKCRNSFNGTLLVMLVWVAMEQLIIILFLGCGAGKCSTTGANNVIHRLCAGQTYTTGYNNIFLGRVLVDVVQ